MKNPIKNIHFLFQILSISLFPFMITFAIYLHLNGETSPGGGFVSGIMIATAFIMISIGFNNVKISFYQINILSAIFMLLYLCLGVCGIIFRNSILDYSFFAIFKINLIKSQQIGIMIVETCVMFVVSSSAYTIYKRFISH